MIDTHLKSSEFDLRHLPTDSAWIGHMPFACFLTELLQPRTFVELGTHSGGSYFAVCQTIQELGRENEAKCWAVDTWEGDEHAIYEGAPIYESVQQHNQENYDKFSTLLRCTFDKALAQFDDGSIDLLHIDGYHTYEAVKHDFDTWRSKLSSNSVVLFHDTNEYHDDFGVWKFWQEIRADFPHLHFGHEHGLGVLFTGSELPAPVRELAGQENQLQSLFYSRSETLRSEVFPEAIPAHIALEIAEENQLKLRNKIDQLREQKDSKQQELITAKEKLKDVRWLSENKNSLFLKCIKPFVRIERSFKKRLGGRPE